VTKERSPRIAFVATNSITQGEQVAQLWPVLFHRSRLEIAFAHRTFVWPGRAAVHCVIVGLTRSGEEVELKPRRVVVYALSIRHPRGSGGPAFPDEERDSRLRGNDEVTLSATVSKGPYIRSLARDIARALGTVGHVSYLRRTRAGLFSIESAISLDFLEEAAKARRLTETVLPLTAALDDIPALPVTPDQARLLHHGQKLVGFPAQPGLQLAILEETPVALVEASADGLRVVRGFNL
jgi:tRNA pseudouridine55 synthase